MQEIDASHLNLETDLSNVRQDLRSKAATSKLEQIELSLADFSTKNDFLKLLNKFESYTTLDSFNKMRIAQEREHQDFKIRISGLVERGQLTQCVNDLKDYVRDCNKQNSLKRDCVKDRKDLQTLAEKIQKDMMELRDDHRTSKDRLRGLEN